MKCGRIKTKYDCYKIVNRGLIDIMDIFDYARSVNSEKESPLASRLRPKTLEPGCRSGTYNRKRQITI